jgi:hypothetical protein
VIDGREVVDLRAPEAPAGGVHPGELHPLLGCDAARRERRDPLGDSIPGQVEIRESRRDVHDLHDDPVGRRDPHRLLPVVIPHRHRTSDREVEEVVDVEHDRLGELHARRTRGDRLVCAELDAVGVGGVLRKWRRHGRRSVGTDGVLRRPDVEHRQRLGRTTG